MKDLFKVSKIYNKMEIKIEVGEKVNQQELGAQLINKILSNIWKAEADVIELVADIKGVEPKELEDKSPTEFFGIVKEILDQEGAKDFFIKALQ